MPEHEDMEANLVSREVIDAWEDILDECAELYGHVAATVSDLGEIKTDLSGSTSKGAPPSLPGGDKLAALGPLSMDAPHDDFPHPLRFAYTWSWHCAEANAAIPPRRAWEPSLAYLRAHLHLIDGDHTADFYRDLRRVLALLRRLCNVGRKSQQEAEDEAVRRGQEASAALQAWAEDIPPLYMLDRGDAELIWPLFALTDEDRMDRMEGYEGKGLTPIADLYWQRVKDRKQYLVERGDSFPPNLFPAFIAREVANSVKGL